MEFPDSQIKITVKDREYVINYPKTGQLIDIERYKAIVSGNRYESIASQSTNFGRYATYLTDTVATLNVLAPELIEHMKVTSILDLDAKDSNILLRAYVKEILPWMNKWHDVLSSDPIAEMEADDEEGQKDS